MGWEFMDRHFFGGRTGGRLCPSVDDKGLNGHLAWWAQHKSTAGLPQLSSDFDVECAVCFET
jgi:hypothetical protein